MAPPGYREKKGDAIGVPNYANGLVFAAVYGWRSFLGDSSSIDENITVPAGRSFDSVCVVPHTTKSDDSIFSKMDSTICSKNQAGSSCPSVMLLKISLGAVPEYIICIAMICFLSFDDPKKKPYPPNDGSHYQ